MDRPADEPNDDVRPAGRDVLWIAGLVLLQCAFFVTRWKMGGNAVDGTLAAILIAAVAVGGVVAWSRPFDLTRLAVGSTVGGLVLLAVLVEFFCALVEPTQRWDEPFVLDAARAFASGGTVGLLDSYSENIWIALRHPPLGPALFGLGMRVFGDNLLALRMITVLFATGTVVIAASIARTLYGDEVARRTGWLLLCFPLFARVGGVVMIDIPMVAPFTLAVALALDRAMRGGRNAGVWIGLLVSMCILTKYTGALVVPVLFAIYFVYGAAYERRGELAVALGIAVACEAGWLWVLSSTGELWAQVDWIWGALRASTESGLFGKWGPTEALLSKMPSAVGLYGVPLILSGLAARAWSQPMRLLVWWILLVAVPLLLTLPDNRYFLPAFPALAILGGLGVVRVFREPRRGLSLALALCLLTVVFYAVMPRAQPVFFFG